MTKAQVKSVGGYIIALAIVLGFFTLASYANTFRNNYYNFGLKFVSFFACGLLLRRYFTKGQAIAGALLYIGLLVFVHTPFEKYRLYITLPAYSFSSIGFVAGYFLKYFKPLATSAFLLLCGGWAWVNAERIYPNFMVARINNVRSAFKADAPLAAIFGHAQLQKGDSTVTLPIGGGKVYLIDFFFNNCPPCRAKEPYLQQIAKEINHPNFEIVYIETGKYDTYEVYKNNYVRLDGKVLYDKDNILSDSLNIERYPFELIIDKTGKLRYTNSGFDATPPVGSLYVTTTKEKIQQLLNE